VSPRAGLDGCGKSCPPTGIRSPDVPARSESLYRLRYHGPRTPLYGFIYLFGFRRRTYASIHRIDSSVGSDVSVGHSVSIFRAI
jgi:hypothetical protein